MVPKVAHGTEMVNALLMYFSNNISVCAGSHAITITTSPLQVSCMMSLRTTIFHSLWVELFSLLVGFYVSWPLVYIIEGKQGTLSSCLIIGRDVDDKTD